MQPLLHFGRDHVEAAICALHHRSVFVVPWCKPPLVANPPFAGLVGGFPSSAPGCWSAMGGWCRGGETWDPHLVLADLLMEEEVVKLHCFRVIPGEGRLQAMQAMSLAPPQGAIGAGIGVFGRPLVPGPPRAAAAGAPRPPCGAALARAAGNATASTRRRRRRRRRLAEVEEGRKGRLATGCGAVSLGFSSVELLKPPRLHTQSAARSEFQVFKSCDLQRQSSRKPVF